MTQNIRDIIVDTLLQMWDNDIFTVVSLKELQEKTNLSKEDIKKVIKDLEKEWSVMFLNNEWWLVYSTEKKFLKKIIRREKVTFRNKFSFQTSSLKWEDTKTTLYIKG